MKTKETVVVALAFLAIAWRAAAADGESKPVPVPTAESKTFPVSISVNAAEALGPAAPFWRFFGADEPNYATMTNGRKLIAELGALAPNQVYFRAHNLLTSGDGRPALKWGSTGAYDEDASGNPIYNWKILDEIFDTYLQRGVKPYVEIGFMPRALSVKPDPYQHHWTPEAKYDEIYTGWAWPPKDYQRWSELVFQWAKHCASKYGVAEVESWFWEVWNESNIGYWRGTPEEFLKLHDFAIEGVRRAVPKARVGGPDAAGSGGRFTRAFLEHCLRGTNFATGRIGTPLDFVSFHAKGSPSYQDGHVRMGIANQLRTINDGFGLVASFPELKQTPIVIGECDPEGCAACQGPSLAYRNGTMFSSYNAACFARIPELAERQGVRLEGALTWAFEFEGQPYFAGFRSLASNGLDKPVLNVFRMLSRMTGRRLALQSDHALGLDAIMKSGVRDQPEVSGIATVDDRAACVMLWHYHDDDLPGPVAAVELTLNGLPVREGPVTVEHFRIDEDHSNAFAAWKRLGSPQQPTAEQYASLEAAGRLGQLNPPQSVQSSNSMVRLNLTLPRQAVSLVRLSWSR
jgi:xylan 1,4-beta-xylosidase